MSEMAILARNAPSGASGNDPLCKLIQEINRHFGFHIPDGDIFHPTKDVESACRNALRRMFYSAVKQDVEKLADLVYHICVGPMSIEAFVDRLREWMSVNLSSQLSTPATANTSFASDVPPTQPTPATSFGSVGAMKLGPSNEVSSRPSDTNYKFNDIAGAGFFCSDIEPLYRGKKLYDRHSRQREICGMTPNSSPAVEVDRWPQDHFMTATLAVDTSKSAFPFKLNLKPPQREDKTYRFARKFGAERWLRVSVPRPSDVRRHDTSFGSTESIQEKILDWLKVGDKRLMGCSWKAFYAKKPKSTQRKRARRAKEESMFDVFFFAESGPGLVTMTCDQVLRWFLSPNENKEMTACKAWARVELGFSPTFPGIVFNPSQIIEVDDFIGEKTKDCPEGRVMDDGCSVMSTQAAKKIWAELGHRGDPPCVFQARIGPWKGVWIVMPPTEGVDPEDDIWIKTTPKQKKFVQHPEDLNGLDEAERCTFEVLNWPRKAESSKLYIDHLHILEACGVPREMLVSFALGVLEEAKAELFDCINDSDSLRYWLHKERKVERRSEEGPVWKGKKKSSIAILVEHIINSGFEYKTNRYLANSIKQLFSQHLEDISQRAGVDVPKSTYVIGIADPLGCLAPNEIHLSFSDPGQFGTSHLDGQDVLVSRHPSLRASDVQRVRAVYKPEFKDFHNVVVFPRTGSFPLAQKLQGGDYDGDQFWILWEDSIVRHFVNVDPANEPKPAGYGITVDRTTLTDVLSQGNRSQTFFDRGFRANLDEGFLGMITKQFENARYKAGLGWATDEGVLSLANLHDLVIDQAKNGYVYTEAVWKEAKKKWGTNQEPLYRSDGKEHTADKHYVNIADYLKFAVIRPQANAIKRAIEAELCCRRATVDDDLSSCFSQIVGLYPEQPHIKAVCEEVKRIIEGYAGSREGEKVFREISKAKTRRIEAMSTKNDIMIASVNQQAEAAEASLVGWFEKQTVEYVWRKVLDKVTNFDQSGFSKVHPAHFTRLKSTPTKYGYSDWQLIKASALHATLNTPHDIPLNVQFLLAGGELCEIKARAHPNAESMRSDKRAGYKFKNKRTADDMNQVPENDSLSADEAMEDQPLSDPTSPKKQRLNPTTLVPLRQKRIEYAVSGSSSRGEQSRPKRRAAQTERFRIVSVDREPHLRRSGPAAVEYLDETTEPDTTDDEATPDDYDTDEAPYETAGEDEVVEDDADARESEPAAAKAAAEQLIDDLSQGCSQLGITK